MPRYTSRRPVPRAYDRPALFFGQPWAWWKAWICSPASDIDTSAPPDMAG